MLTSLTISGFRTFRQLQVDRLTRVNLFVGTNNAGKTSILEAAELLTIGRLSGLTRGPLRRGEEILDREEREIDFSHLFFGHQLEVGKTLEIRGSGEIDRWIRCQVLKGPSKNGEAGTWHAEGSSIETGPLIFNIDSHFGETKLPISPYGGLYSTDRIAIASENRPPVNFLGTESLDAVRLGQLWDAVVLTPEEEGATEALRIIEPRIERIAFVGQSPRVARSIFLKVSDSEQRFPLGSVGDGMKRLLALSLHLLSAKGGYLLVDEIDTGLHYSVMVDMWKLVIETARRLDVQVHATSHSLDCVHALAWVRESNPEFASEVTLHRVERGADKTVPFSLDELVVAARNHVEIR